MRYSYTLVSASKSDFDEDVFVDNFKPMLLDHYRTNEQFDFFKVKKIQLQFSYYDKNGELIAEIPIPDK